MILLVYKGDEIKLDNVCSPIEFDHICVKLGKKMFIFLLLGILGDST